MEDDKLESRSSPLAVPDRVLFSPNSPPATDRESKIEVIGKNKNDKLYERLCNAFLKLANAVPASEAESLLWRTWSKKNTWRRFSCWITTWIISIDFRSIMTKVSYLFRSLRRIVHTSTEMSYNMFLQNAALVLGKQTGSTQDDKIYFESPPRGPRSHPRSAEIGSLARRAVEKQIQCFERLDSVWKIADESNLQFGVWRVQIFSDKYQTSSKADGRAFYSLLVTLLDFSEWIRWVSILSGATVFHILPSHFSRIRPILNSLNQVLCAVEV